MAKDSITDYSATAADNEDIGGIAILGTSPRSNFDNAFRELMSQLADAYAGTAPVFDTFTFSDPADLTKRYRFDAGSVSAGQTRVITIPNFNGTLATLAGTETFTNKTLTQPVITLKQGTAPTAEGDIQWNATDNTLIIGDSSATKTFSPNPATSVDNTVARYDGIKGATQTSGVTIDDSNNIATLGTVTASNGFYFGSARLGGAPDVILQNKQTSGTGGDNATTSFAKLTVNTEVRDPSSLVSVSSSQMTFAVDGWLEWEQEGNAIGIKTKLRNTTDSTEVFGTYGFADSGPNTSAKSSGAAPIVAGKVYELQGRGSGAKTNGFGAASSMGDEVYTQIKFWRTA